MDISIKLFGGPSRDMVGVLQQSRQGTPVRARYLLCRPLGQEAVRTAAIFRVLSDRLAREGCEVLRFDYHGTGDSSGEEDQQSLGDWVEDTLAAHAQLDPGAGVPVNWFGMGLGATLAMRAALRAKTPPAHLVLWEPVMAGPAYVQALLDAHRAELAREFGHPWERLLRQGKVNEPTLPGDVLGFQVGPQLARDLQTLSALDVAPALRRGIRVTCGVHAEQHTPLARLQNGPLLRLHTVEARINWMSSQAMGTAIVPPDLPRTLLSTLD
ncbi:MAG: alpha/beta hydrolase [Burkholderiales bacterium]|nr:alpha/beta hydrolase [Burkholderiales bacterium]